MKSKQNASHPKAGSTYYQPTLTYSFSDFKNSAVIDAEAYIQTKLIYWFMHLSKCILTTSSTSLSTVS